VWHCLFPLQKCSSYHRVPGSLHNDG
jgi:hypothetical protein